MATRYAFLTNNNKNISLVDYVSDNQLLETRVESIADIKPSSNDDTLIVVLPMQWVSVFYTPMPQTSESKARQAIAYALEEHVSEEISQLHFSFDKAHYQNEGYWVAVINKQKMAELIDELNRANIACDSITCDAFCLQDNELAITEQNILVNYNNEISQLPPLLFASRQEFTETTIKRYRFNNSLSIDNEHKGETIASSYPVWAAKRLQENAGVNLCQGEFQIKKRSLAQTKLSKIAAILIIVATVTLVASKSIQVLSLKYHTHRNQQTIATLYKQFFPNAKRVINPEYRIKRLLAQNNNNEQALLKLLNKLALSLNKIDNFHISTITYTRQSLTLVLTMDSFSQLELLKQQLKLKKVNLNQKDASSIAQGIKATLELKS